METGFVSAGVVSHIAIVVMLELLLLPVLPSLMAVRNLLDLVHEIVNTIFPKEFCMLFFNGLAQFFNSIAGILHFDEYLYPSLGHILDAVALANTQYAIDFS